MTEIQRTREVWRGLVAPMRARRNARAARAELAAALRTYTSPSDRTDMEAILARHPESDAHRVWQEVLGDRAA